VSALAVALALVAAGGGAGAQAAEEPAERRLDVRAFQVEKSQSGPVPYYDVVDDGGEPYLRAVYRPPLDTVTMSVRVPEVLRRGVKKVRWRWRAMALPEGGDECREGRTDSAAAVYLVFKSGLNYHALKYVWSAVGRRGAVCARHRNPFTAQDTIILMSGPPLGAWRAEEVDPEREYRAHFARGDPSAEVPDLVAIAIMTDGDQTQSASAADYASFTLVR
jgi:Protein of unknown function (DUF3047)